MEPEINVNAILQIEMPDSCWKCRCSTVGEVSRRLTCLLRIARYVDEYIDDRAPFCPLLPVEGVS